VKGWEVKTLGDVCKVIAGQSPEGKHYNGSGEGLPFYQGKKDFGDKFIEAPRVWTSDVTKEAEAGDILMSVRAPVGPINFSTTKICIGRGLASIRVLKAIDREFLFYMLLSKQGEISGNEGAVFASINKSQIEAIKVAVPNMREQRRIVAILDEAFAGLEVLRANAEKNLQNARDLFDSYLNSASLFEGKEVATRQLATLCDRDRIITYGVIKLGEAVSGGVPCLRTSNVRWLDIETEGMKHIAVALSNEYRRTILRGGEVLVNVRGTLGGVAVVKPEMVGWNVSREIAVVPIDINKIDSFYLAYWIGRKASQSWLTGVLKGAAYTGINIEDLRELPVVFPSLQAQRGIVKHLDRLLIDCRLLEALYSQKLAAIAELKQSILQKAFSGQLTSAETVAA